MITKSTKLFTICIFAVFFCSAQQEVQFTQYMFNGLAINPAYAGHKEVFNCQVTYRNQWADADFIGAPRTIAVSVDQGIPKKKIGLGVHLIKDEIGLQSHTSGFLSFSFRFPVSENTSLALGIAAGMSQYRLDGSKLTPADNLDMVLPIGNATTIMPDAKFGVYLSNDRYYLGVSAANLFNNNVGFAGDQKNIITRQQLHGFFTGGLILPLSETIGIYPSFLIKSDFKAPASGDLNLFLMIRNIVWVGGSIRSAVKVLPNNNFSSDLSGPASAGLSAQLFPSNSFRIGYSYDFNIAGHQYPTGSHEVGLGFYLYKYRPERMVSPRYY
jgi:type IX secretion system PorP/SprF family membrane protein